ncbi:unnamed protein product [Linum trigynum]|uniref:Integrase catalytic domain-containing protein n=1 Tax=Linum trigynum TaxID=586398 RepID=A0AAV2FSM3_9ROSI
MDSNKADTIATKFDGSNFPLWEFQFRNYIAGRKLTSVLMGELKAPGVDATQQQKDDWAALNAQVVTALLGSLDVPTALSLRRFETAREMWRHICGTYSQANTSRLYELELEMAGLAQGDRNVRGYYKHCMHIWTEYDLVTASLLSGDASAEIQKERTRTRVMQFLMKLRSDFEPIRASLIHRGVTNLEEVVAELIREETRLKSQAQIDHGPSESAFAVGRSGNSTRPQFGQQSSGEVICHFCQESGHVQIHCKKRNYCNYCKKDGHIVLECPTLGKRGKIRFPSNSSAGAGPSAPRSAAPPRGTKAAYVVTPSPATNGTSSHNNGGTSLTPEQIRKMVQEALSEALNSAFATGVTPGKYPRWLIDSAAFNHMTSALSTFDKLQPVSRMNLRVANGDQVAVKGRGTISSSAITLPDTLYVPGLLPSLVSVGQLTEEGCNVTFNSNGCVVQDKRTGTVVGKGSKQGRLFVLDDLKGAAGAFGNEELEDRKERVHGLHAHVGSSAAAVTKMESSERKLSLVKKDFVEDLSVKSVDLISNKNISVWDLWHCRLGHPNSARLLTMFRQNLLPGKFEHSVGSQSDCVSCIEAKASQNSFESSETVYAEPFDLVHTDLWGPSPVTSRMGYRYFAKFVDHKTRYAWIYILRRKSELYSLAKEFVQLIKTQFGKTIKTIRSDTGGEFIKQELLDFYKSEGILTQLSCPGVSQQNGLVERKHRHVLELTRALLFHSHVPNGYWVEAVHTVIYLINRQITPTLGQISPYQMLFDRPPDYSRLRVFGCTCFVLLPRAERHKLAPKTVRCVFVGYSEKHKGYCCYDPIGKRMRIAYHVLFLEHVMYYPITPQDKRSHALSLEFLNFVPGLVDMTTSSAHGGQGGNLTNDDDDPHTPSTAAGNSSPTSSSSTSSSSFEGESPPHAHSGTGSSSSNNSTRSSSSSSNSSSSSSGLLKNDENGPENEMEMSNGEGYDQNNGTVVLRRSNRSTLGQPPLRLHDYVGYATTPIFIPATYAQAVGHPEWEMAMQEESNALDANHTWELVPRTPEMSVISSKWVYTIKMNPDDTIDRFKARVVARGFLQEYGIDYNETFAPVVKMQTVRCVFAVAAMRNWPLFQLDVKNAFLHGDLKEVIYMERPPGYTKGSADMVCKLVRSLYGLKQAPRAWFEKFHGVIVQLGFEQSQNDPSLFVRNTVDGIVVLLIYVDDMIITGSDSDGIQELKKSLHGAFKLKDLGDVSYFLGLEVQRSSQGVFVSQKKYMADLLETAHYTDCKPVSTPMEQNLKLTRDSGDLMEDQSLYRSLVGSLIYLTHTRPDISYAVQVVSQFLGVARSQHLDAVHRILRYLKHTQDVGLFFPSAGEEVIEAFADADYAGCPDTRRSTSGWCVRVGRSLVSWRCKKQDRVSKSSTEAEYRSMSDVSSELVWLQRLLKELGVNCRVPMHLYGDNTSAIQIALNPVLHDRTKHIEVHVHYIRQLVTEGRIQLSYLSTEDQPANILTKALASSRHWYLSAKLMLRTQHQFEGGC